MSIGSGDTPVPVWDAGHSRPAARTGVSLLPMKAEDKSVLAPDMFAESQMRPTGRLLVAP
jgi:hypothetical protein